MTRNASIASQTSLALALSLSVPVFALPPGFVQTPVPGVWNQAVGMTFDATGRMFVWEKGGNVWVVPSGGSQPPAPAIDLTEEVGNWSDYGLLGFTIDPNFATNGHVYLLYVVDYHHAAFFGTPQYDPNANEFNRDTIGRLTRLTLDASNDFQSVVPGSRLVLIGQTLQTGLPILHQSHGVGSVMFGSDGTLLLTMGDAASFNKVDVGGPNGGSSNTALAEGIITPAEDVGSFRAQLVDSLCGKVLRIDPATGAGIPSNPFYDPMNPFAARSRVWALGLRNPFRATRRPGTGSPDPAAGDPGEIYIGDVGWLTYEECSVARAPGHNFGWPIFEGLFNNSSYTNAAPQNITAPNPLGGTPGCPNPFFTFRDLIVQETQDNPSWPNPCNTALQIPASLFRFEHTRPIVEWQHGNGPARVPIFQTNGTPSFARVGDVGSPVAGPQFGGNSSTGGVWYTTPDFPAGFTNVYYHADFTGGWIRAFEFHTHGAGARHGEEELVSITPLVDSNEGGAIVALATNPAADGLYYMSYNDVGASEIRRIRYLGGSNIPPVARAAVTPTFGPAPLSVQFSSEGSFDPEGGPLTYRWTLGDGSPDSPLANPTHVYGQFDDITSLAGFTARIFFFSPPRPTGGGNYDPEVWRDGDFPPVGSNDSQRQYDTFHNGDQGGFEWVGYQFASLFPITKLVFQEGIHFFDGGWWDTIFVQYQNAANQWIDLPSTFSPPYAGNNAINFETYQIEFPTVNAKGIRFVGNPGGSANFVSIGELRALAQSALIGGPPARFDATLTVTDDVGFSDSVTVPVWVNNTPPSVQITTPVSGSYYYTDATFTQPLRATMSDAEHAANTLTCRWQVVLHHNDHTHPEPAVNACAHDALITPHGGAGDTFFWEFILTVTDPLGLSTEVRTSIFPAPPRCLGDADFDDDVDFADITTVLANLGAPTPYGDANTSGLVNFGDITTVLSNLGRACP